ncbi:MAG: hypothetical protein ER33_05620 [Cyanobium sp. CACIAM 14]|nr:MAG: hypothetical protein ER33_05620 [Cyanobium sp. CACIAM 14]
MVTMLNRLCLPGALALLLALGLAPAAAQPQAEPAAPAGAARDNAENRPAGFRLVQEKVTHRGREVVGIYGLAADPAQQGLWRVQVWQELDDRVTVATDKISCSVSAPLRITGTRSRLIVRELNPGGVITPANRLDHLIWWAVCVPEQTGRDPASLAAVARRLGYSGQLPEREQILLAPAR